MSTDISKSKIDGAPESHNSPSESVIWDVHTLNKARFLAAGIWPKSKELNFENPIPELAALGYTKFYSGKNADLYIVPNTEPIQVLMYRTDKTSVFNIPLDLEIEGKWKVQNQVSALGAKFAQERGVQTAYKTLPENIPQSIRERCQVLELCRSLEIEIHGEKQGLELIFRNYITGTLFKEYSTGKDSYGLNLPTWLKEWQDIRKNTEAIFTPTDKTKNDNPINSDYVRERLEIAGYGDIVPKLQKLFAEFTQFALDRGYVVVDTKFEVFIDANGQWVIGDEILTPESSRFIKLEDFKKGNYISADKQLIRNIGKQFWWEEKWKALKSIQPDAKVLPVSHEVTGDMRKQVVEGYEHIRTSLS